LSSLNEYRQTVGAPTLTVCRSLNVSASVHADDMRNNGYVSEIGQDGSTPRDRACEAGYAPGCANASMAEVVASGSDDPSYTLEQLKKNAASSVVLNDPVYTMIGVGLSLGGETPVWTLDLGSDADASCP
jgi:uncharacterized protein YkwD